MTNDQIFEALREIVTLARTDPAARCEFDLPLLCGWRHRSELGAMVNRARSAGAVVSLAETGQDMGRTYYQVTAYGSAEALKDVANFILAVAS
ncbi:hypothetical protein ACFY05_32930 [Microtetraspora fusca]|uniref:Uncharacterized protein n=1 Tax=Microtetraspora fusca TaxID=1997 RepID=A0ABW6VF68_MICFU